MPRAFARASMLALSGVGTSGGGTKFRRGERLSPSVLLFGSGTSSRSAGSIRAPLLATA